MNREPRRGRRQTLSSHLLMTSLLGTAGLTSWGCGPCGASGPEEGTCRCSDGTLLEPSECSLCDGMHPTAFGAVNQSLTLSGRVRSACDGTEFTFTLNGNATLRLRGQVTETAQTIVLQRVSPEMDLASRSVSADGEIELEMPLNRGEYRLTVTSSASEEGRFSLVLDLVEAQSAVGAMDPGENTASALDTGVLGDQLESFEEYVGVSDLEDYYRFELLQNSVVTQTLETVAGAVRGDLYKGYVQVDEADDSLWTLSGSVDGATERLNLEAGVYYWRVTETSFSASSAQYRLNLSAEAYPDLGDRSEQGNDARDARDIGVVGESLVEVGGYVGPTDRVDFYRVELLDDAALTYTLKDLVNEGQVELNGFTDAIQLNLSDPDFEATALGPDDLTRCEPLASGVYFIRVRPYAVRRGALYTLLLSTSDGC